MAKDVWTPIGGVRRPRRVGSLYQQVKLARIWLPLTIVGVVLLLQLAIIPLGDTRYQFWVQLLFYSILGPIATYLTLTWIAREVRLREEAQAQLTSLYTELQASHELLGAIQTVTEQFASATDLGAALAAGVRGVTEVTGAQGAAVFVSAGGLELTRGYRLSADLERRAYALARDLQSGRQPPASIAETEDGSNVLSAALVWGGSVEGSLHAFFGHEPGAKQRETFGILASEISAVAEAARGRMKDLLTLHSVDRSIRAEGNLQRLLATLLTQMMDRVDAEVGGVYLSDETGLLELGASHGNGDPTGTPFKVGEGFIGRVAEDAEPCLVGKLSERQRGDGGSLLATAGSAVALPLTADEELLGVMVLAHTEPEHFDTSDLPILDLLAGQLSLAVRNARAYLQTEELAIAEERARIAREIHDGVAQSLAFAALKPDLVERLMDPDASKARAELAISRTTIRETIHEVRRSIFALRPVDLERYGFVETLRRYAGDYGQQNNVQVDLKLGELPDMTLKGEGALFRIFQEAMNNVAKHSGANRVAVVADRDDMGRAFVSVEDNGRGFDLTTVSDRVTSAGGLGLRQMRERIEARGGIFEIITSEGCGTKVLAALPE